MPYRERGRCLRCSWRIDREGWRRPVKIDTSLLDMLKEPDPLAPSIRIEAFYKYFDALGREIEFCPGCGGKIVSKDERSSL